MNPFFAFYHEVFYRPLFNGLVWLYATLPWQDLGLAIIGLMLVVRIILFPVLWKGQKAQRKLSRLQPEIKKIQTKLKDDREAQGKALMALYAENKVNPFSGCLAILVQLPVLFALFQVFQKGLDPAELAILYSFVPNPGFLDPLSFGILDLAKKNVALGVLAAITQYFQGKLTMASMPASPAGQGDFASIFQKQSVYIFPAMIFVWSFAFPSALTFYWTVLNVFGIVQEIVAKKFSKE